MTAKIILKKRRRPAVSGRIAPAHLVERKEIGTEGRAPWPTVVAMTAKFILKTRRRLEERWDLVMAASGSSTDRADVWSLADRSSRV